ncbi:MAG: methylornithine synthase PylB [Desulfobacterales bacterium]|nr:methylornithine synthase PylB [Desulfobacterales bacterium]
MLAKSDNITLRTLVHRLRDGAQGDSISREEIEFLLNLTAPEDLEILFNAAAETRQRYFGKQIFLYGFLYFSTFCRNNCRFCQYRNGNADFPRYRKTPEEVIDAAERMAGSGVHLIDLTMGEDPVWHESGEAGFNSLVELVEEVRNRTGLPVMVSPGVLPEAVLNRLGEAGVHWYACYQETHTPALYGDLRRGQDFDTRIARKQQARSAGILVEEGILSGVGETTADIADSILWMRDFGVDQARVMTFVPQPNTPMAGNPAPDNRRELVTIAVMRLVLKDCLIPASLDVDGLDGLSDRLAAGANVVTSIVPPEQGLAGVANRSLDIEDSRRTLDSILPIITGCGLEAASPEDYLAWADRRRQSHSVK